MTQTTRKFTTAHLSWSDRFALMDHYQPSDTAIMEAFNLTSDELATARQLRSAGTFKASKTLDVSSYNGIFNNATAVVKTPAVATKPTATVHTKPESATKRVKVKVPQKRGRKGDKITSALLAAPTVPTPVDGFMKQHGVSLAVLRQAKRFVEKLDTDTQAKIGKVVVKQDRATKTLMIYRVNE
jgi:hypothetical protein